MSNGNLYPLYLITGIFAITIIAIMCMIVLHCFIKSKNRHIIFYIVFFALLDFWAISTTFYPIMGSASEATTLGLLAVTASYIAFYSLFIFIELINFDKISVLRALFFGCTLNSFILLMIVAPTSMVEFIYNPNIGYLPRPSPILTILQAIILLGIGLEYILTGYRLTKVSETPAQKLQANMIMIGPAIGVLGVVFLPIIRSLIFDYPGYLLLFVSIGMVVAGIGFVKDPNVALFLPFKVYNLMVINSAGTNIFSQNFDATKEVDDVLVSSMISAITNFMEEALGASQLKAIIFGDRYVLLDLRKTFGVFIEAKTSSQILKVALGKFADYFESEFSKYLDETTRDVTIFKSALKGVKDHFGFLPGAWKLD